MSRVPPGVSKYSWIRKATSLSLLDPSEASPRSSWPAAMTRSNLCGSRRPFRQIHTTVPCLRSTLNGTVYIMSNLWRDLPSRRQTYSSIATLPNSSLPGRTCRVSAGLSRSVRSTYAVLFSKISKSGCAGRRKLVLKALKDILLYKRVHRENNFRKCIHPIVWFGLRPQSLRDYVM